MKEWDFGWFGKGIIGDLHYKQAFDRSYAAGRTPGPAPQGLFPAPHCGPGPNPCAVPETGWCFLE